MTEPLARTPEDIVARIGDIADEDMFGWSRELLIGYLPYVDAKPWLQDDVTEGEWEDLRATDPRADLIDYLDFAWSKAIGERGISAGRSIDKIEQWLWLMGDDDLAGRFEAAPYPQYGMPKLLVVTKALAPEKVPPVEDLVGVGDG